MLCETLSPTLLWFVNHNLQLSCGLWNINSNIIMVLNHYIQPYYGLWTINSNIIMVCEP